MSEITQVPYDLIDEAQKISTTTRGRRAQRVYFHTGIQIKTIVYNSLDAEKHNLDLRLCEHGILITDKSGEQHIVGMADILSVKLI